MADINGNFINAQSGFTLAGGTYNPLGATLPKIAWTMDPTNAYNSVAPGASGSGWVRRIAWPYSGTIDRLAIFCIATGSGNCDIGVFNTAPTTRALLAHTGSTALSATAWVQGTISLAVNAGDTVDLAVTVDNATASFATGAMKGNNMATLPTGWIPSTGGGAAKLSAFITSQFPLTTGLLESAMTADLNVPLIIARYV